MWIYLQKMLILQMNFVNALTSELESELQKIYSKDSRAHIRKRAHCILLSNKGFSVPDISTINDLSRNTLLRLIFRWNRIGIDSLEDKKGKGRHPKLSAEQIEFAIGIIRDNPKNLKVAIEKLEEKFGIKVSKDTLKRILKKRDILGDEFVNP